MKDVIHLKNEFNGLDKLINMTNISKEQLDKVRTKCNIIEVINEYIPLNKKGRNYYCVCPFHKDNSPSMSISEEKQIYKCFVCGATGNVFTFMKDYNNISFEEAVSIIEEKLDDVHKTFD